MLDRLRFSLRTDESKQPIIRISDVVQTAEVGVVGISGWELLGLLTQLSGYFQIPGLPSLIGGLGELNVWRVGLSTATLCMVWHQRLFDVVIQSVKDDVGKYGSDDTSYNIAKSLLNYSIY